MINKKARKIKDTYRVCDNPVRPKDGWSMEYLKNLIDYKLKGCNNINSVTGINAKAVRLDKKWKLIQKYEES